LLTGLVSQVTDLDPAGFITRENGCDMSDATTYKFNRPRLLVCVITSTIFNKENDMKRGKR